MREGCGGEDGGHDLVQEGCMWCYLLFFKIYSSISMSTVPSQISRNQPILDAPTYFHMV